MLNLIWDYWYLELALLILGGILATLLKKPAAFLWINFRARAQVIQRYWAFVIPFTLISITSYVLILVFSPDAKTELYINILGQATTLIFAIFVGYFAFAQVAASRLDNLVEQGRNELNNQNFVRASSTFEQALAIAPKSYSVLSNLLELYIINGDYTQFDEKINYLKKIGVEPREKLIPLYLYALKELLQAHLLEARATISDTIQYTKEHPRALETLRWSFTELRVSEPYKNLKGETKRILDNYLRYLERGLGTELQQFEGGDYILTPEPQQKDKK
ncbi:MAG TPA: hypothetical protein VM581_04505 [Magnetospirillaceae bacterium]|nr:hypothetical protein [Magnetospirillaceae bacterium]